MTNTITYVVEEPVQNFKFWAGAKHRMDDATDEQREEVFQRIVEYTISETWTETEINDFVWFDCDDIFFPEEESEV